MIIIDSSGTKYTSSESFLIEIGMTTVPNEFDSNIIEEFVFSNIVD